jgi:hypothetical protein
MTYVKVIFAHRINQISKWHKGNLKQNFYAMLANLLVTPSLLTFNLIYALHYVQISTKVYTLTFLK